MHAKALQHLADARVLATHGRRSARREAAIVAAIDKAVKAISFPAACMRCASPMNAVLLHDGEPLCGDHALKVLGEGDAP